MLRIDPEKIEELKDLVDEDDPDFLKEIIDDYLTDTENSFKIIRNAIEKDDVVTIVRTAHTLKGASGNIGASNMSELAKQLEFLDEEVLIQKAPDLVEQLEREFTEVKIELRKV